MLIRDSSYQEFLEIVRENPHWKYAFTGRSPSGDATIKALLGVLAFFGFMTSQKARVIIELASAFLVISLYLKKNVLDDPRVKEFLINALDTVSSNSRKSYDVIHSYIENKVKGAKHQFH